MASMRISGQFFDQVLTDSVLHHSPPSHHLLTEKAPEWVVLTKSGEVEKRVEP